MTATKPLTWIATAAFTLAALTGCSTPTEEPAPTASAEAVAAETAVVETATPFEELPYPEQVENAWLEGWAVAQFSDIQQPDTDPPRFAAYITDIRSDAPGEITAVITPPAAPDPDALQRFATEEFRLIQNVGTVEVNKLTVTTADGSLTVEGSTDDPYAF